MFIVDIMIKNLKKQTSLIMATRIAKSKYIFELSQVKVGSNIYLIFVTNAKKEINSPIQARNSVFCAIIIKKISKTSILLSLQISTNRTTAFIISDACFSRFHFSANLNGENKRRIKIQFQNRMPYYRMKREFRLAQRIQSPQKDFYNDSIFLIVAKY